MRHLFVWIGALLVATLIVAQPGAMAGTTKTHDVAGTIVSVDVQAQKITFKDEATAATSTVPVLDKAVESLKTVKAGDKVILSCRDNERGEHEGVIAIRPAPAQPAG
jgi:hypothetical protein